MKKILSINEFIEFIKFDLEFDSYEFKLDETNETIAKLTLIKEHVVDDSNFILEKIFLEDISLKNGKSFIKKYDFFYDTENNNIELDFRFATFLKCNGDILRLVEQIKSFLENYDSFEF